MTLAILDGDVFAYRACYHMWEERVKQANILKNDKLIIELDEEGKPKPIVFPKEIDRMFLEKAWNNFKREVRTIVDKLYCTDFLMAVKGDNNYRNLLNPEYKINRHADPTKRNEFVPVIRKLAIMEGYAIEADGREADDLMRIWAEQARAAGDEYIIVTIDKDLQCIPGKLYLMHKEMMIDVPEDVAMRHYYRQILRGDSTDNIPGIPRLGPVKAEKIIKEGLTEAECQEAVVNQYMIAYGDKWYDMLLSNAKMIHLQKDPEDYFRASEWPVLRELNGI
jgi:hypothetical protein